MVTLKENLSPSILPSVISTDRPLVSFIHGASEVCTTVPVSELPSLFRVSMVVWGYVFPSASPTCLSLIHLPSMLAARAGRAAKQISVVIANVFMGYLLTLKTREQAQEFTVQKPQVNSLRF